MSQELGIRRVKKKIKVMAFEENFPGASGVGLYGRHLGRGLD